MWVTVVFPVTCRDLTRAQSWEWVVGPRATQRVPAVLCLRPGPTGQGLTRILTLPVLGQLLQPDPTVHKSLLKCNECNQRREIQGSVCLPVTGTNPKSDSGVALEATGSPVPPSGSLLMNDVAELS